MEFITGVIAGYILTWPTLCILFEFGVLFEHHNARGWAVFVGLVAMAISYFYFAVPLLAVAIYAGVYLFVGMLWSFWRYKRYVEAEVELIRAGSYLARSVDNLHPSRNLDTITCWILIWPISAVESITGDIINITQTLIQKVFHGVYHKIYTAATAPLRAGRR